MDCIDLVNLFAILNIVYVLMFSRKTHPEHAYISATTWAMILFFLPDPYKNITGLVGAVAVLVLDLVTSAIRATKARSQTK